jgi:hypothetical protein
MKKLFYILLILSCSCNKSGDEYSPEDTPVLMAILKGNQTVSDIQFILFNDQLNEPKDIVTSELSIAKQNEENINLSYNNGFYQSPTEFIIENNSTYTITGNYKGQNIEATCTIPPTISNLQGIENDTITINPDPPIGFASYILQWTDLDPDKYSYATVLEVLEENPAVIPFSQESGLFQSKYNGPTEIPGLLLFETDFKYYGLHKLTVFAIEKEYEEVYFYSASDKSGILKNGPDNVLGAKGFVTGVSSFSLQLLVQ